MKKTIMVVVVLAAAMGAAYASGLLGFSNEKLRYKVTVVVETPEGEKTGSAVREAGKYTEPRILPEQGGVFYNVTRGEAVVVDLGERGVLFGLIGLTGERGEAETVFDLSLGKGEAASIVLTPQQYPKFVRFGNLKDPKTVENVRRLDDMENTRKSDPRRPLVSFEGAYGQDVRIKAVVIEMTDEPVSSGIEARLPWISTVGMGNLGGGRFSGPEWYERLGKWDFKKE